MAFSSCRLRSALAFPLAMLLFHVALPRASADVGVVLNESLDVDMDRITSTGHTAIYFSRVCPESPVKLRLCGPGENGSIMSNYINIGEDRSYEWNVVPLNIYLYGVEDSRNRSIFASYKIKHLLEEHYRQKYLPAYCTTESCATSRKSEWREMVAATLIRGVYIFAINTTVEQDLEFIAEFNSSVNKNHFNGVTRNCADFAKRIVNIYFPHSAKADYLNDFGMTSPKAVARTFTHYGLRHPESHLRVMHFAQVPGITKRSRTVRSGTEQLFHSGKLALPMALISYYTVPVVTASYFTTARFNAQKEFERHPASQTQPADATPDTPEEIAGTDAQWKNFRKSLDSILAEHRAAGDRMDLNRLFKQLDETGSPFLDANGAVWLDLSSEQKTARLGLSASNILSADSDPALSYKVLLARARHLLNGPKRNRETMIEFQQDWANLRRASAANSLASAGNSEQGSSASSPSTLSSIPSLRR
ncbi:MAG TPA: hypothetical protein VFN20_14320 [Candidatus Acidoferrum sp.]|nr:hypothetical protein [Candidatus Acidoferrum sp.]